MIWVLVAVGYFVVGCISTVGWAAFDVDLDSWADRDWWSVVVGVGFFWPLWNLGCLVYGAVYGPYWLMRWTAKRYAPRLRAAVLRK